MNQQQFEKAIEKLEKQMMASNRRKRSRRFEGVKLMRVRNGDSIELKQLIRQYNHKARSYNSLGGQLGRLMQQAIDRNAPHARPQDAEGGLIDITLGLLDEWLRVRSNQHQSVFHDVDAQLHSIERRMKRLLDGRDGIKELESKLSALR